MWPQAQEEKEGRERSCAEEEEETQLMKVTKHAYTAVLSIINRSYRLLS